MKSNLNSDVEQFLQAVIPAGKRSRLLPYTTQIERLREDGCSLKQICQFLSEQGVVVSAPGLWKFLKNRTAKEIKTKAPVGNPQKFLDIESRSEHTSPRSEHVISRAETRKQVALEYVKPSSDNPLFKLFNKG